MVVHVDDMSQKVFVKLIPRIDLQALADKLEGRGVPKMKSIIPPQRLINIAEARDMNIRVERKRDARTGDYFDYIGSMPFKDGFLYKTVAMKSISTHNIHPTFDELGKFRQLGEGGDGDMASASTLSAYRKKEALAFSDKELRKYFEPGNHVKVISGLAEGTTGMVTSIVGHKVNLVSDTANENICVFADDVVASSLVTTDLIRIGHYDLHDLVILENNSFGVIVHVDSEAFQVLKGVADRPEVAVVRLREIKRKVEKKGIAQDCFKNPLVVKDVKVIEGPSKGTQGSVEHIFKGVVFIYDRYHLKHGGFICAKAQFCQLIGGSRANGDKYGNPISSRFVHRVTPPRAPLSPMKSYRGCPAMSYGGRHKHVRGHDALVGAYVIIRLGPFKGCKGRVVDTKGNSVRVELEAHMNVISVDCNHITDNVNVSASFREPPRYGLGSETPSHPSRTPLRPLMAPMRDPGATLIHEGMRTPMPDRAWNPLSPPRDDWEDENPASWGSSSLHQFTRVEGRVLPAPDVLISDKKGGYKTLHPANGSWKFNNMGHGLLEPVPIKLWGVVNFSSATENALREYVGALRVHGESIGITIDPPMGFLCEDDLGPAVVEERVDRMIVRVKRDFSYLHPQFLLCILPKGKNCPIYGLWKEYSLVFVGIPTQCIAQKTLTDRRFLTNVLFKINAKLGGLNYLPMEILIKEPSFPTMILGMGLYHVTRPHPAFVSVVTNRDTSNIVRYQAFMVGHQLQDDDVIHNSLFRLEPETNNDWGLIRDTLFQFISNFGSIECDGRPKRTVIFREVGSELLLRKVSVELEAIKAACKHYGGVNYGNWLLTAQRKPHTKNGSVNIPPGTVVDRGICHPKINDFYMCALMQRLLVLHDENGYSSDAIQKLVHGLSYACTSALCEVGSQAGGKDVGTYRPRVAYRA